MRLFDHLDLRVTDRKAATDFYSVIAGTLGFPYHENGDEWVCFCSKPYPEIGEYIAMIEDTSFVANDTCHALWAESRSQVDVIAAALKRAFAPKLEGPDMYYQGHYAVYFEDPTGNRWEVCYREYTPQFDPRIAETKKITQ